MALSLSRKRGMAAASHRRQSISGSIINVYCQCVVAVMANLFNIMKIVANVRNEK